MSRFNQLKDTEDVLKKLSKEQRDNLIWSDRTSILCLDHYILLCAHLSSKADKNKPQV